MQSILSVCNLRKSYQMGDVKVHALQDVSMELFPGEFVVLLGHSGSGKSTLLNMLGGLDTPTSGQVFLRDQDISSFSDQQLTNYRRQHVGFVFQMYNLIPRLTAAENISLVTELVQSPMSPQDALQLVGLGERASHFPAQLSGGEQQRVAIARAVAKKPEILLCDEPTGALDVHTGILVLDAISFVNKSLGTTTAIITHNVAIADMADRVIKLADGKIEFIKQNAKKLRAKDLQW